LKKTRYKNDSNNNEENSGNNLLAKYSTSSSTYSPKLKYSTNNFVATTKNKPVSSNFYSQFIKNKIDSSTLSPVSSSSSNLIALRFFLPYFRLVSIHLSSLLLSIWFQGDNGFFYYR